MAANAIKGIEPAKVLIIDDEPSLLRYFDYNIRAMGYTPKLGQSLADLYAAVEQESYAAILLDLMLPDGESLDALPKIKELCPHSGIVLITAHGTIPKAVTAIQRGATNFLQKPVSIEQLESAVAQAVEMWELRREIRELKRRLEPASEFHGMIGQSEIMQGVYATIESVAPTSIPVMLTGESGTGKELAARAIHAISPRRNHPFIAVNCAAIPRDLLESEIFGHEKGAFTGAIEQRLGCFERADKGTLLLDEICEMDIGLQAKLLRLIEEPTFYRIGGSKEIHVNVRILASTNRDPMQRIAEGTFREDLFYRLNVLPVHLPPLRERREDIPLMATRLLREHAARSGKKFESFSPRALSEIENHPWIGNVRELLNVIEQIVVLNDGEKVEWEMLPRGFVAAVRPFADPHRHELPALSPLMPDDLRPFWQIERDEIQRALYVCDGNVQEAGRRLEISAATLYRKIEKYGLVK